MNAGLRLLPLFLRREGARNELRSAGLTAAGVAVATAIALTVLSFLPGLDGRADRMAWREPTVAASAEAATIAQQRSLDLFDERVIDRVDLAPLDVSADLADLPAPPGLDRFPEAGEIYVSPALQRLLQDTPDGELADRFPGTVRGTIGSAGLAHDDELVAVVGYAAGALDPVPPAQAETNDDRYAGDPSVVVPVTAFAATGRNATLTAYSQAVAVIAVLVTVPAVLLIGSAARLTAARRNQRLAALRLAGATPGGIVALTAVETALSAVLGAAAGVVVYLAALPLAAKFPLAGGAWRTGDLWLGFGPMALALVVVPAIAAASAVVALRQVTISPLGVAHRVSGRRPRAIRFLAVAVSWVVLMVSATTARDGAGIAVLLLGIGAVIGSLALIGPWIAWALGKVLAGLSRRPSTLLAGRRIIDDPKAAYRAVSGIVLAGFIAGLLFAVGPSVDSVDPGDPQTDGMEMWVMDRPLDPDLVTTAEDRLAAAELPATVSLYGDKAGWTLRVEPDDLDDTERVRTTLAGLVPGYPLIGDSEDVYGNDDGFDDFRRITLALLLVALFIAGTATAIGSAASVLDQRVTLGRLRLAGTPVGVLQRARVWHAALPLVAATTASVVSGMFTAYMLLIAGGAADEQIKPPDVPSLIAVLAFGLAVGVGSAAITRPLLVSATAEPT